MNVSAIKLLLTTLTRVSFQLPDGTFIPDHFHVTEVGLVTKKFIDCGGTFRDETVVNFQLWEASDFDHRIKPQKLMAILSRAEQYFKINEYEIEVEYQHTTIGKYDLGFDGQNFQLLNKLTNCLAPDMCGIPVDKQKIELSDVKNQSNCTPGGGCC